MKVSVLLLLCVSTTGCTHTGGNMQTNLTSMNQIHIFKDPAFWQHFQDVVHSKSWKCNFPTDILLENLEKDALLYTDDTVFRKRRYTALTWLKNDTVWINQILGVCKEIADGQRGFYSSEFEKLHMMEPATDFVEHLNCFYTVASEMRLRGKIVKPFSQDYSLLHDIDKLDPVMMVGYSERFEDNQTTSVWDICVERHTQVNPHHQAHCFWNKDGNCCKRCVYCQDIMEKALYEMVCDKVARRLQKNLKGVVSQDMWNVDVMFFKGLPPIWLSKAFELIEEMKYYS